MSSSNIFKQDPLFTPIPLVQRNIDRPLPPKQAAEQPPSTPPPAESKPAPPVAPPPDPAPASALQQARDEGYQQGMADLAAQHQAEFQQALAAFATACQKIDNQRRALLQRSQGDIINLIISLTKKILHQELAQPRNIIASILEAALEQAIESEEYYVTLHPDDLAFAEAKAPELIASVRGLERLVFKTDPTMGRGGCHLESTTCSVDASMESQLAIMQEFLEEEPALLATSGEQEPLAAGLAPEGESRPL